MTNRKRVDLPTDSAFRYTSGFRGRSVPLIRRALYALRALVLSPIVVLEWKAIVGLRKSQSKSAVTFLADLANASQGSGLEFANRLTVLLRYRQTREFDNQRISVTSQSGSDTRIEAIDSAIQKLNTDGFATVREFMQPAKATELLQKIELLPGRDTSGTRYQSQNEWMSQPFTGPRFDTDSTVLASITELSDLTRADFILRIARQYLGCAPIAVSALSWTTKPPRVGSRTELEDAAMAYHCDSDYFSFLKFFVLLTDVREENGPFSFVAASHRGKRHVAGRMPDDEIVGNGDRVLFGTGQSGDLLIADTKGWHKAQPPVRGRRVMIQLLFASNLFGFPN